MQLTSESKDESLLTYIPTLHQLYSYFQRYFKKFLQLLSNYNKIFDCMIPIVTRSLSPSYIMLKRDYRFYNWLVWLHQK